MNIRSKIDYYVCKIIIFFSDKFTDSALFLNDIAHKILDKHIPR